MNIAFVGKAGSGKDFSASYLISAYGFSRVAFADDLKVQAYEAIHGMHTNPREREKVIRWINAHKDFPWMRSFLQSLGVAKREAIDSLYWVQRAFTHMARIEEVTGKQSWVVTDCRFQNEAEQLRGAGFYLARIVRSDREDLGGTLGTHASETEQDSITTGYIVYNPGTPEGLYHELDLMMGYFGDMERVRV